MNCYISIILLILVLIKTTFGYPYSRSNVVQRKNREFCNNLPDHLSDLCDVLATPEHFCGSILSDTLDELCKSNLLGPEDDSTIFTKFSKSRIKRKAADECCISPCSKSHLIYYYCKEPHIIFNNHLKNISSEATENLSNMRNTIKINSKKLSMEDRADGDGNDFSEQVRKRNKHKRKHKIKNGKRRCGCKRGRRKRRGKV